ncbi:MAG: MBL fold metallo-hydrolase [Thermoanaerobaculia bacterium]|nr:MBL fold metallo-hydrolase [Thermoanaerobaculia bacterium]
MRITKYAQSSFLLEDSAGCRLLIDPGRYSFEGAFTPSDLGRVDVLIVTHKHEDHFDRSAVETICRTHSPRVVTNHELAPILKQIGIEATVLNVGATLAHKGFTLTGIVTDHVVRWEGVVNFGVLIASDGRRLYHTSDTRYIEPQLLGLDGPLDVLFVPIGGRGVVMGVDDAALFTVQLAPALVVPMHFDSPKDRARVDPSALALGLSQHARIAVRTLGFGESFALP